MTHATSNPAVPHRRGLLRGLGLGLGALMAGRSVADAGPGSPPVRGSERRGLDDEDGTDRRETARQRRDREREEARLALAGELDAALERAARVPQPVLVLRVPDDATSSRRRERAWRVLLRRPDLLLVLGGCELVAATDEQIAAAAHPELAGARLRDDTWALVLDTDGRKVEAIRGLDPERSERQAERDATEVSRAVLPPHVREELEGLWIRTRPAPRESSTRRLDEFEQTFARRERGLRALHALRLGGRETRLAVTDEVRRTLISLPWAGLRWLPTGEPAPLVCGIGTGPCGTGCSTPEGLVFLQHYTDPAPNVPGPWAPGLPTPSGGTGR